MVSKDRVLFAPQARAAMLHGVDLLTDTLKLTLGPIGRTVACNPNTGGGPPEILTDGATIARRIIRLPDRFENMGMLLARHLAWHVRQAVGDGSATSVVLLRALLRQSTRYEAAGANPMWIRRGMERGLVVALQALREMARPVRGQQRLTELALAATGDHELSKVLGEALDMVGPDGTIEVDTYVAPYLEREYVEGARWKGGYFSRLFATEPDGAMVRLEDPMVVVSDVWAEKAEDIAPVLEAALAAGAKSLLIVAGDIKGAALATMLLNKQKGTLPCVGVKAPDMGLQRYLMLQDMALLTGATVFSKDAHGQLHGIKPEHLGRARRAWANPEYYAIVGGGGDPSAIRARIRDLRAQMREGRLDPEQRKNLGLLLGKLTGGSCILKLGAASKKELDARKQLALDAIASARAAQEEGLVPGGGAAYLHAAERVLSQGWDEEERYGALALAQALREPAAEIARNSGHSASPVVAELQGRPDEFGFDARSGKIVSMWDAGIVDPLKVMRVVLQMAVSLAATTITTDALVLTKTAEAGPFDDTKGDASTLEP